MHFSSLALALNFKALSMLLHRCVVDETLKNNLSEPLIGDTAKFLYTLLLFVTSRVLIIWWKVWS